MKFLDGYKTYIAAAGLFGLALYQVSQGEVSAALQTAMAALAALGLRHAIGQKPEPPAHTTRMPMVLPFLVACLACWALGSALQAAPPREKPVTLSPCAAECKCGCNQGKICECKQPAADIEGCFDAVCVQGEEVSRGLALIQRKGDAYVVQWMYLGVPAQVGVGFRMGDQLHVGWATPGGMKGVTVYKVQGGVRAPMLEGRWISLPGNGVLHQEKLTFFKPLPQGD